MKKLFTSESVTAGHPDKLCDQVSDAVLDAILSEDPEARVACETCATTGLLLVMGEITTSSHVSFQEIARGVAHDLGYTRAKYGFDASTCAVLIAMNKQSKDIASGVSNALESRGQKDTHMTGAGDQGMMFGYACTETPELMPLPISAAHQLARRMDTIRKSRQFPWMRPDGKSQVSVIYEDGKPVAIQNVVISVHHDEKVSQETIREVMMEEVVKKILPEHLLTKDTEYLVNPSGRFVIGGPAGDSGLTGRKIIVDTYGGFAPHGGGCFSGKDPTKVDRSGAYMARYTAVNVVAAGLAERCQIALAYAIGRAYPVSFTVDTFGTGKVPDEVIEKALLSIMDFRPDGIIETLNLRRPIYRQTAAYGHFGRLDLDLPWEKADKKDALLKAIS